MRTFRWLPLAAALLVVGSAGTAHAIIHLELEGGGGLNLRGPQAPIATASVRLNVLSLLDVGLRGEYVFGSAPVTINCDCNKPSISGYRAWMVFPELRLSTPTPVIKFDIAVGGGLGYLTGIDISPDAADGNGAAKPYGQAGIGIKVSIPTTDIYVRAEGSVSLWTGVSGPDVGNGLNPGILPTYQALLMLGYEGIGF